MAQESRSYPLVEAVVKRSHLPRLWAITVVAVVLVLLLILAAFLDGALTALSERSFWRESMQAPVIIIYILVVYPFIWRLWERAVQAFRPLLSLEDDAFNQPAVEVPVPKRHREWVAVLVGAGFLLALSRPWIWVDQWLDVYMTVTDVLMFGLLGWLVYHGLADTQHLAQLSRQNLKLDIFDSGLLTPVARWSLGTSVAFIGGISLSLVFQTKESLLEWTSITIYAVLVGATVLLFFLSMRNIHSAMTSAKRRELAIVRKNLVDARRKLKEQATQGLMDGIDRLYPAVAAWGMYERQVQEASVWPFNAGIIRRLIASIIVPAIVYLIKILAGLGLRF
jgi:uncharacterized integral membrane protein